jgi:hypothetical protein
MTISAPANPYRPMPRGQRLSVYVVSSVLWVSGVLWLILAQFFARHEQFGRTPHPLEAPLLLIHGTVAIFAVYILGWVSARHALHWWVGGVRRWSGAAFAALVVVLSVSGFALFFVSSDQWQHYTRLTHEVIGIPIVVFAVQHWLFGRLRHAPIGSRI